MTLITCGESEDHDDHDYDEFVIKPETDSEDHDDYDCDESVIKPGTDEERAARLEAQRQKDAPKAL
jgi:hypothetical protein